MHNVYPLHRQPLPLARQGRVAPGSALPTPFGQVSEPRGNVIRPARFVRPIDPTTIERIYREREQQIVDEPECSFGEGWWIIAGIVSALFWIALFFAAGRMGWLA